jgi:hypothetical protein
VSSSLPPLKEAQRNQTLIVPRTPEPHRPANVDAFISEYEYPDHDKSER